MRLDSCSSFYCTSSLSTKHEAYVYLYPVILSTYNLYYKTSNLIWSSSKGVEETKISRTALTLVLIHMQFMYVYSSSHCNRTAF